MLEVLHTRRLDVVRGAWTSSTSSSEAPEQVAERLGELFNLVHDPATLSVAWSRVAGNTRARSAGVDGRRAADVEDAGVQAFLDDLRESVKAGTFRPMPIRERMIPKPVVMGRCAGWAFRTSPTGWCRRR